MADTIAVMNDGRIEQAGGAADLYERPQHRVRRQLPRRLEPRRRAHARLAERPLDGRDARRRDAARARATGSARTAPTRSRIGVRPEKVTLSPAGDATSPAAHNVLRGTVVVASFLGVSIQYVVRAAGGEELTVFAQNLDGAEPESLGAGPRGPARLGPAAHVRRRQGEVMTDPVRARTRAVPGGAAPVAPALPRPRRQRRARADRACPALLAACGGIEGTGRTEEEAAAGRGRGQPPEDRDRRLDVLQLAALHGQEDPQGVRQGVRRQGPSTSRTSTTTTSSSARSASSSSRAQPIGRDIVVLTDCMASRWVRNGYVEPIDKKNVPNASNLVDNLATINYDQERKFTLP